MKDARFGASALKPSPRRWGFRRRRPPERPVLREGLDWAAAGWAGLVAGGAFILAEIALLKAAGAGRFEDIVRQTASIALDEEALGSAPLSAIEYLSAGVVHLPLSLLYARILAGVIDGMEPRRSVAVGAVFGVLLYGLNYYVFSPIFPWFAFARDWTVVLAHIVFGVVAAAVYAYETRDRSHPTMYHR